MKRGLLILLVIILSFTLVSAQDVGSECFASKECGPGLECVGTICVDLSSGVDLAPELPDVQFPDIVIDTTVVEEPEEIELPSVLSCLPSSDVVRSGNIFTLRTERGLISYTIQDRKLRFVEGGPFRVFPLNQDPVDVDSFEIDFSRGPIGAVNYENFEDEQQIVVDFRNYGRSIAQAAETPIYTYDEDSLLIGEFFVQPEGEPCELGQVEECSDGLDNDNDGVIDFKGACVFPGLERWTVCGCDVDGNGNLNDGEYMVEQLCANAEYFCETLDGQRISARCNGQYFNPDPFCIDVDGEEGDALSCVQKYIIEFEQNDYFELFPEATDLSLFDDPQRKQQMEDWCMLKYEGGVETCTSVDQCEEGFFCDVKNTFACKPIDVLEDKMFCRTHQECGQASVCKDNVCIENIEGFELNPFFSPFIQIGQTGRDIFTSRENLDYQQQRLYWELKERALLDQAFEEGKFTERQYENRIANNLRKRSAIQEDAIEIISERIATGDESAFRSLNIVATLGASTEREIEEIRSTNPELIMEFAPLQETEFTLDRIKEIIKESNAPAGIRLNALTEEEQLQIREEEFETGLTNLPSYIQNEIREGEATDALVERLQEAGILVAGDGRLRTSSLDSLGELDLVLETEQGREITAIRDLDLARETVEAVTEGEATTPRFQAVDDSTQLTFTRTRTEQTATTFQQAREQGLTAEQIRQRQAALTDGTQETAPQQAAQQEQLTLRQRVQQLTPEQQARLRQRATGSVILDFLLFRKE